MDLKRTNEYELKGTNEDIWREQMNRNEEDKLIDLKKTNNRNEGDKWMELLEKTKKVNK